MEDIKEKEVKELPFTNVDIKKFDVAELDTEHVYVFKLSEEAVKGVSVENIKSLLTNFNERLSKLGIKYIVLAGDLFSITELVPSKKSEVLLKRVKTNDRRRI